MSYTRTTRTTLGPRGRNTPLGAVMSALGADEPPLPPMPAAGAVDEQVMLLRRIAAAEERFVAQEKKLRYLQIGAILAVPLAGAVWRFILGKKNVPSI